MCPIFDGSALSCLTRYQEILSGCSLVCKNQWESACHTTDFHNRHHINIHRCTKCLNQFPRASFNKMTSIISTYSWFRTVRQKLAEQGTGVWKYAALFVRGKRFFLPLCSLDEEIIWGYEKSRKQLYVRLQNVIISNDLFCLLT